MRYHELHELLGFHISFEELVKRKNIYDAPCMPYSYFGTVSSLLQSVDNHGLWEGLTDGIDEYIGFVSILTAQPWYSYFGNYNNSLR